MKQSDELLKPPDGFGAVIWLIGICISIIILGIVFLGCKDEIVQPEKQFKINGVWESKIFNANYKLNEKKVAKISSI